MGPCLVSVDLLRGRFAPRMPPLCEPLLYGVVKLCTYVQLCAKLASSSCTCALFKSGYATFEYIMVPSQVPE